MPILESCQKVPFQSKIMCKNSFHVQILTATPLSWCPYRPEKPKYWNRRGKVAGDLPGQVPLGSLHPHLHCFSNYISAVQCNVPQKCCEGAKEQQCTSKLIGQVRPYPHLRIGSHAILHQKAQNRILSQSQGVFIDWF